MPHSGGTPQFFVDTELYFYKNAPASIICVAGKKQIKIKVQFRK
jgi:hypothetical protein